MSRIACVVLLLVGICLSQQNPSQLSPFQPYQQPPYPALAGFRVQVAAGTVNVGTGTVSIPVQTIYVQPNSTTYIYLNVTTGTIQSDTGGFGTGIYPIAIATSNASYVYSLVDSRPNVFNNGTGGGGGGGTITGPASAVVNNVVCWTSPAGLTIGDCGVSFPLSNANLANSTITVNSGAGLTGGGAISLGGTASLSLLTTCSNGQVLQWNGSTWVCATNGTITGVTAGLGLTGGGSSGSPTLSLLTSCGNGQVLQWNGSTWACASITAAPGGLTTQVQFNLAGALAGDSTFFFNSLTHALTVHILNFDQLSGTQPYSVVTAIPLTSTCTPTLAGNSSIGISSDGNWAVSNNGSPCVDIVPSGGTGIVGNPGVGVSQTIVQPPGTQFNSNDFNNISYPISADNWSQSPSGSLTAGSQVITLTTCPRGLWQNVTSNVFANIYLSTVGTAEVAPITATTCPVMGSVAGGTITVTVANSHGAGYTVGSASQGLQEAIFAAGYIPDFSGGTTELGSFVVAPAQYTVLGRVFVTSPYSTTDFSGSVLKCKQLDAQACIFVGAPGHATYTWHSTVKNITFQAACNNCNYPALEDGGQQIIMQGITAGNSFPSGSATSGFSFGSLIQVDNDQAAVIDGFSSYQGRWQHCATDFCSVGVKGAGGGGNAGILYIKNSNMNLNCTANGVDNQNANTMRISDSVIEAQAQFAVRATATYGDIPSVELDNVYMEVAGCAGSNPLGIGIAGLILEGGYASIKSSVGPTGSMQKFVNTGNSGATQFNYYVVAHTTAGSLVSPPYLAGAALSDQTGSNNITVKFPQFGTTPTITYDIIRTSGLANSPAPYLAVCGGGSITACGTVTTASTGITCSTVGSYHICSFVDSASASTSAALIGTLPAVGTYWPNFGDAVNPVFWGGAIVNSAASDQVGVSPSASGISIDRMGDNVANSASISTGLNQVVNIYGTLNPMIFAQTCSASYLTGGAWISCGENSNGSGQNGAVLLSTGFYNAADTAALKGKIIFEAMTGQVLGGHKITVVDSNSAKTLNTVSLRPGYDANDTWIGLDNSTSVAATAANAQLAFGAPVSISNYIANVGDGTSALEKLTASLKTFTVPITTNSQITSTLASGTPPFVVASQTRISNMTVGGNPVLRKCGTTVACSNSPEINAYRVHGTVPLVAGTATVSGLPFAGTTWTCTTSDNTTAANGSNMIEASATTGTVTGTGTDVISYGCDGN